LDLPNRGLTIINESGLYAVILRSDKPNAKQFRKWVTSEILPSIRKHGAYINEEVLRRMREDRAYSEELLNILTVERIRNAALYNKVAQLVPKAIYHDIILQCPDAVQVSIIAKDYGMSAVAFNKLLYRLKVQFRMGNTWLLYQKYADKGYSISKTFLINGRQASMHTYFTQRGRFWLYELLKSHGILPEAEKRANRQMTFDDAGTSA
jgi:phage antirepressor YoqD-like protein